MRHHVSVRPPRRAVVLLLTAVMMVVMLGVIAFAVDLGYIVLVRGQLQAAADAAAMAAAASMGGTATEGRTAATEFAGYNKAAGRNVTIGAGDVVFGTWDASARTFTASSDPNSFGNAVKVVARIGDSTGGNSLFFGRIFGRNTFDVEASAIAMGNPRDIAFVIDLSGSMNNDTEPCWATYEITNKFTPLGYSTLGTDMMQQLYTDLGFGAFPGTLQWIGSPLGVAQDSYAYANLTKDSGPLADSGIASTYRITSSDTESTRKVKAYKWIIDNQLAVLMPAARPVPNSATSYAFYQKYLDYLIQQKTVNTGTGTPPTYRGTIPAIASGTLTITGCGNPYTDCYPEAGTTERNSYRNQVGYRTFVQFMMDYGRNLCPADGTYVQTSRYSADCPWHSESTAGGTFSFPPSEQPTHAARRALIAAIQEVKERNQTVPDTNQRDWVSIVTYDAVSGTTVHRALTSDYDAAMTACTLLQAAGDDALTTATETGLIKALQHIDKASNGGQGREHTQKVVVLLTDGVPNLKSSGNTTISNYRTAHPSTDFYGGSGDNYYYDAALMQAHAMEALGWKVYAVGVGLGCDYEFMDRMARMGSTENDDNQRPRTSGHPISYEQELSAIFRQIITNPQVRLVK